MILRGYFFSNTLEMETGISVLIPNRPSGGGPRKVAYLLHGLCGRNGDWLDYTMLPVYAERFDTTFIMPDAARSFYSDMVFGQRYFDYIARELPAVARSAFNVSSRRKDTLILGASMGGYGALKCALAFPERYGSCAAFSAPCLFLKEGLEAQRAFGKTQDYENRWGRQLLNDFESIFGPELSWRPEDDILELARRAGGLEAKPRLYLACGTEDGMLGDNRRFASEMKDVALDFTYQEWAGVHDWSFFNSALEKSLDFLLDRA